MHGIRVLRFWNIELMENEEGVLTTILQELAGRTMNPHPDPLPSQKGEGTERRELGQT